MIDPTHLSTLGRIMPGDALEYLQDMLADPGAYHSMGELARMGAALAAVGDQLTTAAKDGMHDRLAGGVGPSAREVEDGVLFTWRRPQERTALKTAAVKEMLPIDQYPDMYTTRTVRGGVSVQIADISGGGNG